MKKKLTKIADLLPEGLTEDTINAIAQLVQEHAEEKFQEAVKGLSAKVMSFITVHSDKVKESALRQLNEENKDYARANLMEQFFQAASILNKQEDEENAITTLVTENKEVEEEKGILVTELNEALEQNGKMEKAIKILKSRYDSTLEKYETLLESYKTLEEQKKEPFKSSEKTVVMTKDGKVGSNGPDTKITEGKEEWADNPFLTEELMKFMPKVK